MQQITQQGLQIKEAESLPTYTAERGKRPRDVLGGVNSFINQDQPGRRGILGDTSPLEPPKAEEKGLEPASAGGGKGINSTPPVGERQGDNVPREPQSFYTPANAIEIARRMLYDATEGSFEKHRRLGIAELFHDRKEQFGDKKNLQYFENESILISLMPSASTAPHILSILHTLRSYDLPARIDPKLQHADWSNTMVRLAGTLAILQQPLDAERIYDIFERTYKDADRALWISNAAKVLKKNPSDSLSGQNLVTYLDNLLNQYSPEQLLSFERMLDPRLKDMIQKLKLADPNHLSKVVTVSYMGKTIPLVTTEKPIDALYVKVASLFDLAKHDYLETGNIQRAIELIQANAIHTNWSINPLYRDFMLRPYNTDPVTQLMLPEEVQVWKAFMIGLIAANIPLNS